MAFRSACPQAANSILLGLHQVVKGSRRGASPIAWNRRYSWGGVLSSSRTSKVADVGDLPSNGSARSSSGVAFGSTSCVSKSEALLQALYSGRVSSCAARAVVCVQVRRCNNSQGRGTSGATGVKKDGLPENGTAITSNPIDSKEGKGPPPAGVKSNEPLPKEGGTLEGSVPVHAEREDESARNKTLWQKVRHYRDLAKLMWKRYGLVAIGFYYSMYVVGFGGMFAALDFNLVESTIDTSAAISKLGGLIGTDNYPFLAEKLEVLRDTVESNRRAEHLFLAFMGNEILDPGREVLVLVFTPSIARALGRAPAKGT